MNPLTPIGALYLRMMDWLSGVHDTEPNLARRTFGQQAATSAVTTMLGGGDPARAADEAAKAVAFLHGFNGTYGGSFPKFFYGLHDSRQVLRGGRTFIAQSAAKTQAEFLEHYPKMEEGHRLLLEHLSHLNPDALMDRYFAKNTYAFDNICERYRISIGESRELNVRDFMEKLPTPQSLLDQANSRLHAVIADAEAFLQRAQPYVEKFRSVNRAVPDGVIREIAGLPAQNDPEYAEKKAELDKVVEEHFEPKTARDQPPPYDPAPYKKFLHDLFGGMHFGWNEESNRYYTLVAASPEEMQQVTSAVKTLLKLRHEKLAGPLFRTSPSHEAYLEISRQNANDINYLMAAYRSVLSSGVHLGEWTEALKTIKTFGEKQQAAAFGRDMKSHTR